MAVPDFSLPHDFRHGLLHRVCLRDAVVNSTITTLPAKRIVPGHSSGPFIVQLPQASDDLELLPGMVFLFGALFGEISEMHIGQRRRGDA